MEAAETFPRVGIPIAKMDCLRSLLEKNAFSLTSNNHNAEQIPIILSEGKKRLKKLIEGKPRRLIFDETTRLGDAIAVTVHFWRRGVQTRSSAWLTR